METTVKKVTEISKGFAIAFLLPETSLLKDFNFSDGEIGYVNSHFEDKKDLVVVPRVPELFFVRKAVAGNCATGICEKLRGDGATVFSTLKSENQQGVCVVDLAGNQDALTSFMEGLLLASYDFNKYKTEKREELFALKEMHVVSPVMDEPDIDSLINLVDAVFLTRDLVNEPVAELNAVDLSEKIQELGNEAGFSVDVYNKSKIEALKFGGLLGVNRGSVDPPTFSVMEWKPENPVNDKPYVLVGKGVVFDTGGMNLKTMPGSLDTMKCDMGGAASVVGAIYAISKNKIPVHVVGLVPATDNRPGKNAFVPGDILKMHNGLTVEVKNTDAEGRLILADALSYAQKYRPELVIDLATLTGAAAVAIGAFGTVAMGTASKTVFEKLITAGDDVHERLVQFPFWDDYDALIKSDIADVKNLGSREGGAITAGKFLARFTNYPWVHLDIAGPAFLDKKDSYRGIGGTGVGVRLLYRFFSQLS